MSKETFKSFARLHPELASSVISGKVTWQKLYELYDIYGETSSIWNPYFKETTSSIKDLFNTFRNIDMESVQQGVTNLQKTIGLLQELGVSKTTPTYEPRPIYRRFDD